VTRSLSTTNIDTIDTARWWIITIRSSFHLHTRILFTFHSQYTNRNNNALAKIITHLYITVASATVLYCSSATGTVPLLLLLVRYSTVALLLVRYLLVLLPIPTVLTWLMDKTAQIPCYWSVASVSCSVSMTSTYGTVGVVCCTVPQWQGHLARFTVTTTSTVQYGSSATGTVPLLLLVT